MPSSLLLPGGWLEQFASTYKEWHYFAGGLGIGSFVTMLLSYLRARLHRRMAHAE